MTDITPHDTRYTPIQQQPYCCCPACVTMVMLRRNLPLVSQELLGHHLGLVVPDEDQHLFWNARHAPTPPTSAGYGTQVFSEGYSFNEAFERLGIPLLFEYIGADSLVSPGHMVRTAQSLIENGHDVLLCYNTGTLRNMPERDWGHVVCLDQINETELRVVDSGDGAKWKTHSTTDMFTAIKTHGQARYGGLWVFKTPNTTAPT